MPSATLRGSRAGRSLPANVPNRRSQTGATFRAHSRVSRALSPCLPFVSSVYFVVALLLNATTRNFSLPRVCSTRSSLNHTLPP
jgi:hypothetical protein